MIGFIYKITGLNKYYIGSTINLVKRLAYHELPTNTCTSRQIIAAGDYTVEILDTINFNKKSQLLRLEQVYILQFAGPGLVNRNAAYVSPEARFKRNTEYYARMLTEQSLRSRCLL